MGNVLSDWIQSLGKATVGKTLSKSTQEEQDQLNKLAMMEAMKSASPAQVPPQVLMQMLHSGDEVNNYLKQGAMADQMPMPFSYDNSNYDWVVNGSTVPTAEDWVGQQYKTLFSKTPGKYRPAKRK